MPYVTCHVSAKIPDLPALSERAEGRANNSANLNCKFQPVLGHGRLFMRFPSKKEEKSDGKAQPDEHDQNAIFASSWLSGRTPDSIALASSSSRRIWATSGSSPSNFSSSRRWPKKDTEQTSP